jgi:hypothetical protein
LTLRGTQTLAPVVQPVASRYTDCAIPAPNKYILLLTFYTLHITNVHIHLQYVLFATMFNQTIQTSANTAANVRSIVLRQTTDSKPVRMNIRWSRIQASASISMFAIPLFLYGFCALHSSYIRIKNIHLSHIVNIWQCVRRTHKHFVR